MLRLRTNTSSANTFDDNRIYGAATCPPAGLTTLTPDDPNAFSVSYAWAESGGGLSATGTMTRTEILGGGVPSNFIGVWQGSIHTPDAPDYLALVTITQGGAGEVVGHIAYYATLMCGGRWLLVGATNVLTVTERLSYRSSVCVNGGTVILTPQTDDRLTYEWGGNPGFPVDVGTLFRLNERLPRNLFLPFLRR